MPDAKADEDLDRKAEAAWVEFAAKTESHGAAAWVVAAIWKGGYRARATEEAAALPVSRLCKCGCPELWHVPHHAHSKLTSASTFCACFDFVPVTEEAAGKVDHANGCGELIAEIRFALSIPNPDFVQSEAVHSDAVAALDKLAAMLGGKP